MDTLYDDRYHLHLGYYENNSDFECVAFKRSSEDIWDIFFDFKSYGLEIKRDDALSSNEFGVKIFSIPTKNLDYNLAAKEYEHWLSSNKLI